MMEENAALIQTNGCLKEDNAYLKDENELLKWENYQLKSEQKDLETAVTEKVAKINNLDKQESVVIDNICSLGAKCNELELNDEPTRLFNQKFAS